MRLKFDIPSPLFGATLAPVFPSVEMQMAELNAAFQSHPINFTWPSLAVNDDAERLTVRENEIAACVGRGLSSKLIGHQLGISEHTVRKHRENIARKLNLRSAAELVAWSIRRQPS
jgi:DNA-binding CsgD family transcriptional regulator